MTRKPIRFDPICAWLADMDDDFERNFPNPTPGLVAERKAYFSAILAEAELSGA